MHTHAETNLEEETLRLLNWLGYFGKDPEGGISRLLYSESWVKAQKALETLFVDEGLKVQYDEIGNLFGRLEGNKYFDETILTGSHVDTVKNGGLYDGQYGIIAGVLAVKYLKERYGPPLRNIEVVSMAEEEGSRFPFTFWGSKNIVGETGPEDVKHLQDFNGISFVDAMHGAGFTFNSHPIRMDFKSFVELHIEQGNVLEIENKSVGIVEHIVGQRRFTFEITGEANHAGTTPMKYRKDAVNAVSRMVHTIYNTAIQFGDPLVATVGRINIEPNIVNVVPGNATFTLDARHIDKNVLNQFTDQVISETEQIADKMGMIVKADMWMDADPVPMNPELVEVIQRLCDENAVNYKKMHSGAGHDAQIIAPHIPTAMIFVPSHKGISHSPYEFTDVNDLTEGVKVLAQTLYELAYSDEEV